MQVNVGEYIRQLRRQRSLTQTELGGIRYSKSYVSAVERDKIVPSHDALRFFATQLDQSAETFEQLLLQSEQIKQSSLRIPETYVDPVDDHNEQEIVALLDLILQGKDYHTTPLPQIIANLSLDMGAQSSQQKQARYAFLKGLQAQKDGDLNTAQVNLEYASVLVPTEYQPAIFDALGINCFEACAYESALGYHTRALKLLEGSQEQDADLLLRIELHCANDYHALRAHYEASLHYEQARRYLRATHNMQMAGELYLGLGYSLYASLYQTKAVHSSPSATLQPSYEEMDRTYQLALSFLLQSRTLYQVCSDQRGEFTARLTQTMVLLDFSTWRQHIALENARTSGRSPFTNCTSLLDEAEEQCRQVLLGWQGASSESTPPSVDQKIILYTACAYFARVFTQRATLARMGEYSDTAARERSLAISICQQILDSLQRQTFDWSLVHSTATLSGTSASYRSQALPRLLDSSLIVDQHPIILTEIYFAAGEISEELGKASTSSEYARMCYSSADNFLQLALSAAHFETSDKKRDSSYLMRIYQRYANILEQRLIEPFAAEDTPQKVMSVFKEALLVLQHPTLYNTKP